MGGWRMFGLVNLMETATLSSHDICDHADHAALLLHSHERHQRRRVQKSSNIANGVQMSLLIDLKILCTAKTVYD